MAKNNNYQNRQSQPAKSTSAPVPEKIEVVADDQTAKTPPESESEIDTDGIEETETQNADVNVDKAVVETVDDSLTVSVNVLRLRELLATFTEANNALGKTPEHFRESAKLSSTITKFIIKNPRADVLDCLYDFFVEHKNDVCSDESFMKGSTTLPPVEERQVGFLFGLFSNLANDRAIRVSRTLVINVLKKTEIADYYARRARGAFVD